MINTQRDALRKLINSWRGRACLGKGRWGAGAGLFDTPWKVFQQCANDLEKTLEEVDPVPLNRWDPTIAAILKENGPMRSGELTKAVLKAFPGSNPGTVLNAIGTAARRGTVSRELRWREDGKGPRVYWYFLPEGS